MRKRSDADTFGGNAGLFARVQVEYDVTVDVFWDGDEWTAEAVAYHPHYVGMEENGTASSSDVGYAIEEAIENCFVYSDNIDFDASDYWDLVEEAESWYEENEEELTASRRRAHVAHRRYSPRKR